jgi:hypothetical protein
MAWAIKTATLTAMNPQPKAEIKIFGCLFLTVHS